MYVGLGKAIGKPREMNFRNCVIRTSSAQFVRRQIQELTDHTT